METKIGENILRFRKTKNITQEQLADIVGVSAPAVSKWENGISLPDIALLAPLARALGVTVDTLLSFQSELSEAEVNALEQEVKNIFQTKGFDEGMSKAENLLREYSNSTYLKFRLGGIFQNYLSLKPDITEEEVQLYFKKGAQIYEDVLNSKDPKLSQAAALILSSFYLILGEMDKSEKILESLPSFPVNSDDLYPAFYSLKGDLNKAGKILKTNLYKALNSATSSLSGLYSVALKQNDQDKAFLFAKLHCDLVKRFQMQDVICFDALITSLLKKGETEEAFEVFEEYVQSILNLDYDYSDHPLFDEVELKVDHYMVANLKKMLTGNIKEEAKYIPLKSGEKYEMLIKKLEAEIS